MAAALLTLIACAPAGEDAEGERAFGAAITEPEATRVDAVPQEEPGLARNRWRAVNESARTVTGNLTASLEEGRGGPLALAFANGVTLRGELLTVHDASARVGGQIANFRTLLALPSQVDARVYRVIDETVTLSAGQGLCGEARTTSVAAAEFVGESGRWVLHIAAFRGAVAPGEGGDPGFCGVFGFEQPQ